MHHHAQLIFVFLVESGFHLVDQDGLRLLTSGDPPTSASQSAWITGVNHHTRPKFPIFNVFNDTKTQRTQERMRGRKKIGKMWFQKTIFQSEVGDQKTKR